MKTREIADFLSAELSGDGDVEIVGVADIASASPSQLAFATRDITGKQSYAGCVIVSQDSEMKASGAVIRIADPKLAFARVAELLHPQKKREAGISPSSFLAESASIGNNVAVGAFCSIGDGARIGDNTHIQSGCTVRENVTIGENCLLHPNVVIEDGCVVGDNVILHAGIVIGADGFGFVRGADRYIKFPQLGTVVIENDVEIGANSCIDRGSLGETRIGAGTKIDNLVQIAHNVQIGKRVVIAAQTGISGSSVIEDDCVIGGQVGMGDHVRIKSGAVIGSQAGVLPGKIVRAGVWWGTPVQPLEEYKRQNARLKGIERLKAEVAELKRAAKS